MVRPARGLPITDGLPEPDALVAEGLVLAVAGVVVLAGVLRDGAGLGLADAAGGVVLATGAGVDIGGAVAEQPVNSMTSTRQSPRGMPAA